MKPYFWDSLNSIPVVLGATGLNWTGASAATYKLMALYYLQVFGSVSPQRIPFDAKIKQNFYLMHQNLFREIGLIGIFVWHERSGHLSEMNRPELLSMSGNASPSLFDWDC